MKRKLLVTSASIALAAASQAAYIVIDDNFDSYSSVGDSMNGKGNWVVSNNTPSAPYAVALDNSWSSSGSQSAVIGGYLPTAAALTSLSQVVNVPIVPLSYPSTVFSVDVYLADFQGGTRHPFSITLNSGLTNLLTINLSPAAAGSYNVAWNSDMNPDNSGPGGYPSGASPYAVMNDDTFTTFTFETFSLDNGATVSYRFSDTGGLISSGNLTTANPAGFINSFSINYDGSSLVEGTSWINVDNVLLVPEPSSALLGLLGAAFAFTRRRR